MKYSENANDLKALSLSYLPSLKDCGKKKDLNEGIRLHAEICAVGLLRNLGSTLISMYAKCGTLSKAQEVLYELPVRDVVAWTALIAGYAQQGQGEEAMDCFNRVQMEGLSPNAITYACTLKACGITKEVEMGKKIHNEIVCQGLLRTNVVLGNALINMYAKCGVFTSACQVLKELSVRNLVSWNILISGYIHDGQDKEALECFDWMQCEGLSPNTITYACVLKACGSMGDVERGKQIHDEVSNHGLLGKDVVLGNALIDMYVKCDAPERAQEVLDELPVRNTVSWNALMAGCVRRGQGEEALGCFDRMLEEGLSPDVVTYSCALKACGITQDVEMGKQIDDEIQSRGLLGKNVVLGTSLVDMYAKCGMLMKAEKVLFELPVRNIVSWSALIAGYAREGLGKEALQCYEKMQSDGISPNAVVYACILKVCGIAQDLERGKQIHDEIVSQKLFGENIELGNALVDMYAKCGAFRKAQQVLEDLPTRNEVSWSALISAYVQQGQCKEAIDCYNQMQRNGVTPNEVTYACILKACGMIKEVDSGKHIHDEIVSEGLLARSPVIGSALVDMYAKLGMHKKALQALNELSVQDVVGWNALIAGYAQHGWGKKAMVCLRQMQSEGLSPDLVSWNAVIGGYAQHGHGEEALHCFQLMQCDDIPPDAITFVSLLTSCSHSGLVDEGRTIFHDMKQRYGITPDMNHQTCMIDLFGRAGHFDEAIAVVQKMPSPDCAPAWSALMGACQKWQNVNLARVAFEHAVNLNECDNAAYVCMKSIYVAVEMQEATGKV